MLARPWARPLARTLRGIGARCYWTQISDLPAPVLNYKAIAQDAEAHARNFDIRKSLVPEDAVQSIVSLRARRVELKRQSEEAARQRKKVTDQIKKNPGDPEVKKAALEGKVLKERLVEVTAQLEDVENRLLSLALRLPNDTHPDVPVGPESAAKLLSEHGPPLTEASPQRDHVTIANALKLLDLDSGRLVTGSSWYYLVNEGALLEMALTNYAMSLAVKRGFTPVMTPDVIRADAAQRCGFQPRDPDGASQMYHIAPDNEVGTSGHADLILAGTAEIPLAGMFAGQTFKPKELPRKVVGLGHAFRAEAGAGGADTRGLYRVHQFTKLELFAVTPADESEATMEEFRSLQTEIFEGLGLTFRVLDMPTEELGASAYRKYDMEAWMPGRGKWGEISSTSNCTDYQSRRLHIRYQTNEHGLHPETKKPWTVTTSHFAHTLNGTAVAVPRLIVALLENGAVLNDAGEAVALNLPKALLPFWVNGLDRGIIRWI